MTVIQCHLMLNYDSIKFICDINYLQMKILLELINNYHEYLIRHWTSFDVDLSWLDWKLGGCWVMIACEFYGLEMNDCFA